MDRLIFTAVTGMNAAMNRQRAVANNLANANTPGFRAEEFAVTPATLQGPSIEARAMAQGAVRGVDMTGGRISATGQPLDIAIKGNALMAVQAEDGSEVYTRRGDLHITASGVLENGDGLPVIGTSGPITVPTGTTISIGEDGTVYAADPAVRDAPPQEVGQIKLADPTGSPLLKDIQGFLRVPGNGILPTDATARVTTGALEMSNVDTAATLVDMIEAQRAFEQRTRLISTASDIDEAGARLMSLR